MNSFNLDTLTVNIHNIPPERFSFWHHIFHLKEFKRQYIDPDHILFVHKYFYICILGFGNVYTN